MRFAGAGLFIQPWYQDNFASRVKGLFIFLILFAPSYLRAAEQNQPSIFSDFRHELTVDGSLGPLLRLSNQHPAATVSLRYDYVLQPLSGIIIEPGDELGIHSSWSYAKLSSEHNLSTFTLLAALTRNFPRYRTHISNAFFAGVGLGLSFGMNTSLPETSYGTRFSFSFEVGKRFALNQDGSITYKPSLSFTKIEQVNWAVILNFLSFSGFLE